MLLQIKNIRILLVILLGLPQISQAQANASASFSASVTIIEPIEIQTTSEMNFASIDAGTGGSVILNPDNTRNTTGDVRLDNAANVSAAIFEVKGQKGYSYHINIPEGSFNMVNGLEKIVIKDFNTSSRNSSLNSGAQIISLGATLEIEPGQKPGLYITPTPIEITVSYN